MFIPKKIRSMNDKCFNILFLDSLLVCILLWSNKLLGSLYYGAGLANHNPSFNPINHSSDNQEYVAFAITSRVFAFIFELSNDEHSQGNI